MHPQRAPSQVADAGRRLLPGYSDHVRIRDGAPDDHYRQYEPGCLR